MAKTIKIFICFYIFVGCRSANENIENKNTTSMRFEEISQNEFVALSKSDTQKVMLEKYLGYYYLVFKMANGKIIVNNKGVCRIYENTEDLEAEIGRDLAKTGSNEILYNKNPFNERFPEHSLELTGQLLSLLDLKNQTINNELLLKIDSLIDVMPDPQQFRQKNFLNIVSIIGEVSNKELNTRWKMQLAEDFNTWYPNLEYRGSVIKFVLYLYEDVFTNDSVVVENPIYENYKTIEGIIKFNLRG